MPLLRDVATPVAATLGVVNSKSLLYEMSLLLCHYSSCRYSIFRYSSRCYSGCRYFKITTTPDVITQSCCYSSRRYSCFPLLQSSLLLQMLLWLSLLIYTPTNMDTDISLPPLDSMLPLHIPRLQTTLFLRWYLSITTEFPGTFSTKFSGFG